MNALFPGFARKQIAVSGACIKLAPTAPRWTIRSA